MATNSNHAIRMNVSGVSVVIAPRIGKIHLGKIGCNDFSQFLVRRPVLTNRPAFSIPEDFVSDRFLLILSR